MIEYNEPTTYEVLTSDEIKFIKSFGIKISKKLHEQSHNINRYVCLKYKKGAIFMIDKKDISKDDEELIKIRKKIDDKAFKLIL